MCCDYKPMATNKRVLSTPWLESIKTGSRKPTLVVQVLRTLPDSQKTKFLGAQERYRNLPRVFPTNTLKSKNVTEKDESKERS